MHGKICAVLITFLICLSACKRSTATNDVEDSDTAPVSASGTESSSSTDEGSSFSLSSFSGVVNQNSVAVTFTLGPNASSFEAVRLTRVQGANAPSNCEVGTVLSTVESLVDNSVIVINDSGLRVATDYSYRVCYAETGSNSFASSDSLTLTGITTGIIQPFCDAPPCAPPQGAESDGTFTSGLLTDSRNNAGIIVDDINNDGNPDLIASFDAINSVDDDETPVEVWLKSGGTWVYETSVGKDSNNGFSSAIATADLDNDNRLDLVVGPWLGGVETLVHWGDGAGDFTGSHSLSGSNHTSLRKIYLTDLNGDGFLDILSAIDGNFQTNMNNTDKTFAAAVTLGSGNTSRLLISDYDNDGDQDIIQTVFSGPLTLYKNDGTGNFDGGTDIDNPNTTIDSQCSAIGDIDNDGDLDIFFVQNTEKARVLEGNGDGTFQTSTELTADTTIDMYYGDCHFADLNGDENLDFLMASAGEIMVIWGDGTLDPGVRVSVWTQTGTEQLWNFSVADLNGDSILDIVGAIKTDSQDDILLYGNAP